MKAIILNQNELTYLLLLSYLFSEWAFLIEESIKKIEDTYLLTLSEKKADELRDLCDEQLLSI